VSHCKREMARQAAYPEGSPARASAMACSTALSACPVVGASLRSSAACSDAAKGVITVLPAAR